MLLLIMSMILLSVNLWFLNEDRLTLQYVVALNIIWYILIIGYLFVRTFI